MPKKTVEQVVQQQQHYLIALKANQPTLHRTLVQLHRAGSALTVTETVETSHNRTVHRRVCVYAAPLALQQQWAGLRSLIWVERWGVRDQAPFHEQVGYISDLELTAVEFLLHIQQHWSIENRLHWVRDVTFDEDHARPGGHAPVLWAVLNCFLISIVRPALATVLSLRGCAASLTKSSASLGFLLKVFLRLNETTLLWAASKALPLQLGTTVTQLL